MSGLLIFAIILGILGILGSVLPGLPGPPLSWIGMLLVYLSDEADPMTKKVLFIWLAVVVLITLLDYVLPIFMTREFGGHKAASVGAMLGLFAGMFFTPVGMIGGSILGAFIAEFFFEDGGVWESFKASLGAFVGFIVTTVGKLVVAGWIFIVILRHII